MWEKIRENQYGGIFSLVTPSSDNDIEYFKKNILERFIVCVVVMSTLLGKKAKKV